MNELIEQVESTNSLLAKASMLKEIEITEKTIVENVAKYYGIEPDEIRSISRKGKILIPRYVSMAFILFSVKKNYKGIIKNITLKETGKYFSRRDHSTVINAINKLSDMVYTDPIDRESVENLIKFMQGRGLCKGISIDWIININNSANF